MTSISPNGPTRGWCRGGGPFDLDDYVDYLIAMLHRARRQRACDGGVPAVGAGGGRGFRMEANGDPHVPHSMTLMGGPIDTRQQSDRSQQSRRRARHRLVSQQRHHQGAVSKSRGDARRLSGLPAAQRLHQHESRPPHAGAPQPVPESREGRWRFVDKHREFYDEYLAVMDLTRGILSADLRYRVRPARTAKGEMTHRGVRVDPSQDQPRRADDGRRRERRYFRPRPDRGGAPAVHRYPVDRKMHWLQPDVGHYGVFNGSRFRSEIVPRIADFVLSMNASPAQPQATAPAPAAQNHRWRQPPRGNGQAACGSAIDSRLAEGSGSSILFGLCGKAGWRDFHAIRPPEPRPDRHVD